MSGTKSNSNNVTGLVHQRKVLLVDDHPVVHEGLTQLFKTEGDLVICHTARLVTEALQALDLSKPDVVVMDLLLGDGGHGLELIKNIRARHNSVPILVFTTFDETTYALRALQAGAQGYVMKHESPERLLSAIRTVLKGDYALSPQTSTRFLQNVLQPSKPAANSVGPTPVDRLGDRELEVFELLGKGIGTREIAAKLGCSIKTIETYRARIKEKLQLTSATTLIREAVRWVESRQ